MNNVNRHVAILMGTFNGESHLQEQLDSILQQSWSHWSITISDDHSSDQTLEIAERFRSEHPERVTIVEGPAEGFAKNFLSMVANSELHSDYYAYCDQDDIWLPNKLERACNWLDTVPADVPALYCSRSHLIDDNGELIGKSALFSRDPEFSNALVQSIAGGNTMVFNNAARSAMGLSGGTPDVLSHDWWSYLAVTGCGGIVYYDTNPTVLYRQHRDNLVGSNRGILAKSRRLWALVRGIRRSHSTRNLAALRGIWSSLTEESHRCANLFSVAHNATLYKRVAAFLKCRPFRQSSLDNVAIFFAVLMKKL